MRQNSLVNFYSFSFDGIDDFIDFGSSNYAYERTNSFSVSGIFRVDAISHTANKVIITNDNGSTRGWTVYIGGSVSGSFLRSFGFRLHSDAGSNRIIQENTIADVIKSGIPYFFCITYDGSSTAEGIKMYLVEYGNELLAAMTKAAPIADALTGTIVSSDNLRIGIFNNLTGDFRGNIQDIAIYSESLSLEQIQKVYFKRQYPNSIESLWLGESTDGGQTATDDGFGGFIITINDEVGSVDGSCNYTGPTRYVPNFVNSLRILSGTRQTASNRQSSGTRLPV